MALETGRFKVCQFLPATALRVLRDVLFFLQKSSEGLGGSKAPGSSCLFVEGLLRGSRRVLAAEVPLGVDLANIRNLAAARRRTFFLCHPNPVSFLQTQSREGV